MKYIADNHRLNKKNLKSLEQEIADLEEMISVDPEHEHLINRKIISLKKLKMDHPYKPAMLIRWEIEIMYSNKKEWDTFFEHFASEMEAATRLIHVRASFPKNKFRIVPVYFPKGQMHSTGRLVNWDEGG